ncbi:MAG TPA: nucleoside diphosphate kinase regulator [Chitinophagaceae bacterium]|nr:nucleoside diphosphate kinase regulator [Chitinophagaceae bacterium]
MQKINNSLVLRKDDYEILLSCLRSMNYKNAFDRSNAEELQAELKRAKLVSKEKFPADVVRLNSRVKIREEKKDTVMELELVIPEKADIRQRKILVMAPVGTALIGFRQGQKVAWQVPSGKKTFVIMEVINE